MRHLITRRGLLAGMAAAAAPEGRFVRVSRKNPRYLELDDGSPYIPIGPNICWERFLTDEQAVLAKTDERFRKTAQNGGNFTRVWLSHPFYDIEPGHPGEYDATRAARTGKLLAIARRHGIRVKLCLEHFRTLEESPPRFPAPSRWAARITGSRTVVPFET